MTIHAKGGPSKINYSEGRGEGDTNILVARKIKLIS
jgi:hypothetical protein